MNPPHVEMVEIVTREHAETFVSDFIATVISDWAIQSFGLAELMIWPEDDRDAQGRYMGIEDAIVTRTFAAVRAAMVEAFFAAATDAHERDR